MSREDDVVGPPDRTAPMDEKSAEMARRAKKALDVAMALDRRRRTGGVHAEETIRVDRRPVPDDD